MSADHTYEVTVEWSGETADYTRYSRDHTVRSQARSTILGTADASFLGTPERWNPEQLLVSALAQCHMLWFLGLAANSGVIVTSYVDHAIGHMVEHPDGAGEFSEVVLRPEVTLRAGVSERRLTRLHERAHEKCFIARSVNFPVRCEASSSTFL
ncbi:OsmC family protein [Hoyosella altamirensis]|uniref:Organic hydroperoxide reductase OsmC/OhrA n=1 Tax=Hoyosella altamirensis TaxID=616997 RepID=A0A839RLB8_9ACTN|nr:OsmC family protein [Hoyosella altamirensis]MBB3036853.1 organic hydroperoxide reductase OsmC/OhrA [Hoyosella altamirensis]